MSFFRRSMLPGTVQARSQPLAIRRWACASVITLAALFHPLIEPPAMAQNPVTTLVQNELGTCQIEEKYPGLLLTNGRERLPEVHLVYPARPWEQTPYVTCNPSDGQAVNLRVEFYPLIGVDGGEEKTTTAYITVDDKPYTYTGTTTATDFGLVDTEGRMKRKAGSRLNLSDRTKIGSRLKVSKKDGGTGDILIPLHTGLRFSISTGGVFRLTLEPAPAEQPSAPVAAAAPSAVTGTGAAPAPPAGVQEPSGPVSHEETESPHLLLIPGPNSRFAVGLEGIQLRREAEGNQRLEMLMWNALVRIGSSPFFVGLAGRHQRVGVQPDGEDRAQPKVTAHSLLLNGAYGLLGGPFTLILRGAAGTVYTIPQTFRSGTPATETNSGKLRLPALEAGVEMSYGSQFGLRLEGTNEATLPFHAQATVEFWRMRMDANLLWTRLMDYNREGRQVDASATMENVIGRGSVRLALVDRRNFMAGLVAAAEVEQLKSDSAMRPMGGLAFRVQAWDQEFFLTALGTQKGQFALQIGAGNDAGPWMYEADAHQIGSGGEVTREAGLRVVR